jgi:hypothetical protein
MFSYCVKGGDGREDGHEPGECGEGGLVWHREKTVVGLVWATRTQDRSRLASPARHSDTSLLEQQRCDSIGVSAQGVGVWKRGGLQDAWG